MADDPTVNVSDVSNTLGVLSKMMGTLEGLSAFATNEIKLTEWLILHAVSEDDTITASGLVRKFGISAQRVAQLLQELRTKKHINIVPHPDDARKKNLSMTKSGGALLTRLDREVMSALNKAVSERPKSLGIIERFGRMVVNSNRPAKVASKS